MNKAHEKWLKKMGAHPDQIKARKVKTKTCSTKGGVAKSYYEDKPLKGGPVLKREETKTLDNKNLAFRIMEESRTSPRDLGGDRDYA